MAEVTSSLKVELKMERVVNNKVKNGKGRQPMAESSSVTSL